MVRSARTGLGVLVVALLAGLTGCADLASSAAAGTPVAVATAGPGESAAPSPAPEPSPPHEDPAEPGTALAALAELEVKGRAPKTGYDRELFGAGWGDPDRNGCDARNDVLARDLTGKTFVPGTRNCLVATGTLADPFSGRAIPFRRGQDTSDDVQIDHVVAVSDAWQKGAQAWDGRRRVAFYNDPLNLLAVDGPLNLQKGDGDAATWLPPDRGFRCGYVARQIAVKRTYGLWLTAAERDAMTRILSGCPHQPLPGGTDATRPDPTTATGRTPAVPPSPAGVPFENCTAARAAGAAPLHRGDPGYAGSMDGDQDGVACE